jgi:hypothetical protein
VADYFLLTAILYNRAIPAWVPPAVVDVLAGDDAAAWDVILDSVETTATEGPNARILQAALARQPLPALQSRLRLAMSAPLPVYWAAEEDPAGDIDKHD